MSLNPFEDILALGKAPSADPAKADALKEVTELKIQLDSMAQSVPEDEEDLAEDQEMWCTRWHKLLSEVHTSFQCAQEHSIDTALEADLLTRMQEQEEERAETAARAAKAALAQVAKVAGSGEQEQVPVVEQVVESLAPGPVQESADEPPTTESPSEEQESVSSAGQKRKHVSSQVVVDEEEDEEEEIVEVMAPKPSKAPAGPKMVTHHPPCNPCQRGGRTCTGVPSRTCDSCIQLKTKCGKSKGKAGRAKAPVPAPKAKGKEKRQQRPVCNNARVVIPARKAPVASSSRVEADVPNFFRFSPSPEPDSNHKDDNVMPRKKRYVPDCLCKTKETVYSSREAEEDAAIETMKLVLLTMRTKMHGMLGFLTELQACAKVAEMYISSQQLEMEEMEALLEEL
ncbi:hypothetical protein HD554DRAFT_2177018 [Boletus coccyginus]|nr:hypothetical protein HD554DRAFT_2177018 [Boletus coccyginus]